MMTTDVSAQLVCNTFYTFIYLDIISHHKIIISYEKKTNYIAL